MNDQLTALVSKINSNWESMDNESFNAIQKLVSEFALNGLDKNVCYSPKGTELYRDLERGIVLTAYTETDGIYRVPHDHGNGWVVYSVAKGSMEMGSFFNWIKSKDESQLILKDKIVLESGDVRLYYPGEIHDTKCLSERAVVVRLTSCDLKVEESEGRMKRY